VKLHRALLFAASLAAGHAALASTMFYAPTTDQTGSGAGQILKVNTSGAVTPWNINWAGGITLEDPQGMAWDGRGDLFINDGANILKVDPAGNGSIFATKPNAYGLAIDGIDANDNVYAVGITSAYSITFDSSGNLYVVGASSLNRVYKITLGGVKTTFVNSSLSQGGAS